MAEIKETLPCIADPKKIRVIGRINVKEDFKEMMPYVAWLIPNSAYNKKMGWISFKKGVRIITIHSDGFVTHDDPDKRREGSDADIGGSRADR